MDTARCITHCARVAIGCPIIFNLSLLVQIDLNVGRCTGTWAGTSEGATLNFCARVEELAPEAPRENREYADDSDGAAAAACDADNSWCREHGLSWLI